MAREIDIQYGKKGLTFSLPDAADLLEINDPEYDVDERRFAEHLLAAMPEYSDPPGRVAIVVADKTRRCGYDIYLPQVLKVLTEKGIRASQITFFIAYGTHARQSDEECLAVYGKTYQTHTFVHHDSTDLSLFEECGSTPQGTRVRIRKDILESDLIISFGALSHHYFAGYGGGRKLLFPGLGFVQDIYHNHSLFLDKKKRKLSSGCSPGSLEKNPLARDLKQIDAYLRTPRIHIHAIVDSAARVCRLLVSKKWKGFEAACARLNSYYKVGKKKRYQLVVASCGGYPRDINFIQAHKAIHNAAMFVKDGGTLVVLAQCPDQIGSQAFLEYFDFSNFTRAFDAISGNYKGNGGTALCMMEKSARIKIFLKTDLDDNICARIGVEKITQDQIRTLMERFKNDMACIRNASLLIF